MKANEYHIDDELLVKYLLREASSVEQEAVNEWINSNPENKKYFDHFRLIWDTSKNLVIPSTVNAEEAWTRFQQRTQQGSKPAIIRQMNSSRLWMTASVIAIVAISVALIGYFLLDRSAGSPIRVVSIASPLRDTLPDGSLVTLNKNSSITYEKKFTGAQRKVKLEGEAFFSVTPDKEKPFVISVNDLTVTVVGTSFNIKNVHGKTQVVVESGIVRVTRNHKTVELHQLEKILADPASTVLEKDSVTDRLHQYYRSKEFVCDSTPLWKLVEVLNEAYDVNIIIARNDLRSQPLTTTFYNESLDKILSVIAETFEISVDKKGTQIILK